MEPDTHVRTKYCKNCKNRIHIMHFDVHSAQCLSQPSPQYIIQPKKEKENKNKIQDIPSPKDTKSESDQNTEVFACYLCGFNQTLSDLDTHQFTCPNRQVKCNYCSFDFPTSIISDHKSICPHKPLALSIPPQMPLSSPAQTSVQNVNNSQTIIRYVSVNSENPSQSISMTVNRNPPSVYVQPQMITNQNIFTVNLANNPPNIFIPRPHIPSRPNNSQFQSQCKLPQHIRRQDISNQISQHERPNVFPPPTRIERNQAMNLSLNTHQPSNNSASQSRSQHGRLQQIESQNHTNQNSQTAIINQPNYFRNNSQQYQRRMNELDRYSQELQRQRSELYNRLNELIRRREEMNAYMRRWILRTTNIIELANRYNQQQSTGLREQQIANILDKKYTKTAKQEETQNCSICFCQIQQNQLIKDLPCKHLYHKQCISKWLTINTACPLCKFNIATLVRNSQEERNAQAAREIAVRREIGWFHDEDDEDEQEENLEL